jgi:hypothetical protein
MDDPMTAFAAVIGSLVTRLEAMETRANAKDKEDAANRGRSRGRCQSRAARQAASQANQVQPTTTAPAQVHAVNVSDVVTETLRKLGLADKMAEN